MRFEESLSIGRASESAIAKWLRSRGWAVLPAYEKAGSEFKGPQVFFPESCALVAPDFLSWRGKCARWIEAKHKTAFSWHRITQRWVTGIDLRHYMDYCALANKSPWPVWLLFLHTGGQAKDSPVSPAGLFGQTLDELRLRENHRSSQWGRSGMVYWAVDSLIRLADADSLAQDVAENDECMVAA